MTPPPSVTWRARGSTPWPSACPAIRCRGPCWPRSAGRWSLPRPTARAGPARPRFDDAFAEDRPANDRAANAWTADPAGRPGSTIRRHRAWSGRCAHCRPRSGGRMTRARLEAVVRSLAEADGDTASARRAAWPAALLSRRPGLRKIGVVAEAGRRSWPCRALAGGRVFNLSPTGDPQPAGRQPCSPTSAPPTRQAPGIAVARSPTRAWARRSATAPETGDEFHEMGDEIPHHVPRGTSPELEQAGPDRARRAQDRRRRFNCSGRVRALQALEPEG